MADNKELKPKSFRIDDETAEKFKNISATIGGNQQETLAKLIEAFEFQSGKAVLTEKKSDIEQFEKYVNAITRMYMSSLEDNQNITETVRTEFDALLKSKDTTIQDLQSQLVTAKQLKEEATTRAKTFADENSRLNDHINSLNTEYNSKMEDIQSMLADKDNLNKALVSANQEQKDKIAELTAKVEEYTEAKNNYEKLNIEHNILKTNCNALELAVTKEKEQHEQIMAELKKHESDALERVREQSQIALDKALLELEKQYQEQIQQLKAEKQSEVDKYQQKYFDLLEQIKNNSAAVE